MPNAGSSDVGAFGQAAVRFYQVGAKGPIAIARALNHTGAKVRTQMIRALVPQTGLKRKTIVKALVRKGASASGLVYVIKSKGGNISLKYFAARETRAGVTAAPWGQRKLYPAAFLKGGRFPKRVALALGGHAFARTGTPRTPIKKVKSGLFIPTEMVIGATKDAFERTVASELPKRINHELSRMI